MEECILDKVLLVIGGGIESVPGINIAKKLGVTVVVSDINPNAPAFDVCDYKILSSTYNFEQTGLLAKKFSKEIRKIDGVICLAADVPYTVSWVANELNISNCNSLITANLSSNKYEMKLKFQKDRIPIPNFWKINTFKQLLEIIKKNGFPIVIKPLDGRGARGVYLLNENHDIEFYFNESKKYTNLDYLLVEQYLSGPQISTEALIVNGVGYSIGFCDRNYELLENYSPYIIENGGDMPTSLSNIDKYNIEQTAIKAGLALGVENGIVKGDMVLTKDGPKVIEIATRLSGGYFSSNQIPLNSGVNIVEYAIKLALDIDFNNEKLKPKINLGVAIRYLFLNPGKIAKIENLDFIKNIDFVHKFQLFIDEGDEIVKITDHTKRCGFVITTGVTKIQAIERAEFLIEQISNKIKYS
jgi:biotin carboxylase